MNASVSGGVRWQRLGSNSKIIITTVMGRKNWLFANTPGGALVSSVIYSLIETTKESSLDPCRYLLWLLRNAPQLSETDEAWAERLLPANAPKEYYMPQ